MTEEAIINLSPDIKASCKWCNEYEGSERQVRGHEMRCKMRPQNKKPEAVQPPDVPRETEAKAEPELPPKRRERIPFGVPQKKLNAPDDDQFNYRVFNDGWSKEPGRIQRAMNAGYEVVENWPRVAVGTNEDGSAIMGVLMKIPKEWYEEDQKLKQKEVDRVDQAIKTGKIEAKEDDKRYIPDGIKIWSSHNENR